MSFFNDGESAQTKSHQAIDEYLQRREKPNFKLNVRGNLEEKKKIKQWKRLVQKEKNRME